MHGAHRADNDAKRGDDRGENDPGAKPIDEAADTDRKERSDQRGPQVQLCVIDAANLQIGNERLSDEAEALCSSRKRADHGRGRE